MLQTSQKAQAGLEYLMTYGWALVLIAAVVAVLVFIVSSPASGVTFSSSAPTKIMVKAGAIQGTNAAAQLTNVTGGRLNITSISAAGASYTTCTINEETTNIDVPAGSTMELNCPVSGEDPTGAVTITYTDFAGLEREAIIRIAGGTGATSGSPGELCESGGTGTQEDPYILTTIAEVQAMNNNPGAYYELCQDIDASATSGWNGGQGFDPIGSNTAPFTGNFDGKGYKITGLYINRATEDWVGLFGFVDSGGEIRNVGLENIDITGNNWVGGLAGYSFGSVIDRSYSTGSVSGYETVGGLFGADNGTATTNSYSTAIVQGTNYVGGLAGYDWGTITNCYAAGNVTGTGIYGIGGLIGYISYTTVVNSYYPGDDIACTGCTNTLGQTTKANLQSQTWLTTTPNAWDFATIWNINDGSSYPFLR